jgi:hypothetical protein
VSRTGEIEGKGKEWVEMRGDVVGEGNSGKGELNVAGETLDRFYDCLRTCNKSIGNSKAPSQRCSELYLS